jgi:hypothetical protein
VAIVHCRLGCIHPEVDDEWVYACFSAGLVEEIEPEDLAWYHGSPPTSPCSCGAEPVEPYQEAWERIKPEAEAREREQRLADEAGPVVESPLRILLARTRKANTDAGGPESA